MHITLKNSLEIEMMREGGYLLSSFLKKICELVKPGVRMDELNRYAAQVMSEAHARPAFLGYGETKNTKKFPAVVCISRNDEVVHGVGSRRIALVEGDIVGLDLGIQYPEHDGFYTDMARTVAVGTIDTEAERLISVTEEALVRACACVRDGAYVHDISRAIQTWCESNGYAVIRDLTGHGIGRSLHEDPPIFCYDERRLPRIQLQAGMVICIEPMVAQGDSRISLDEDQWTVRTADGSLAAHVEQTILVTRDGYEVLTPFF